MGCPGLFFLFLFFSLGILISNLLEKSDMAVEYDLIVIGNSPEGIYAATTAAYFNGRVALVEQPYKGFQGWLEEIFIRSLMDKVCLPQKLENKFDIDSQSRDLEIIEKPVIELGQIQSWIEEVISICNESNSLAILASLGVDVISGSGEFCRLPYQAFVVNERRLRSRAYLIATGSHQIVPYIDRLSEVGYLTTADIWQKNNWTSLPHNLVIVGGNSIAIGLAQNLRRLGKEIILVVEGSRILPKEDSEVSSLIQAKLEAEGVKILTHNRVTQVKRIENKKWLQVGDLAIETDEILLVGRRQPNVAGLNLQGVNVELGKSGLQLNEKLQTTNPRIYGCGDITSGYQFTHIAQYEAHIAVKNALFFPLFKVDYSSIPWAIFTEPSLARVGMTEEQARRRYGQDVLVAQEYVKDISQGQVLGETTGFCKIIVRGSGEILGAYIVGAKAEELIGAIALAMRNKIKIASLADFTYPYPTLSEIIQKTARQWHRERLRKNKTLQNLYKSWFNWQRKWFS